MLFELLVFLLAERSVCFVLHVIFTGKNTLLRSPAVGDPGLRPDFGIQTQPLRLLPLWAQARFEQVRLTSASVRYYKGYVDLPHRDVVRINKCW